MAVYRFSAKLISRSSGRSATAAAAYRSGQRIADRRTDVVHDYSRRGGVIHAEILTPDDTPDWMGDRVELWNAVEAVERRKDAQLAREVQLSLPHELSPEQRIELTREFVREQFVDRGMIADIAIHAPGAEGDDRNHHAHVMLTTRELTHDGFGKKERDWNDKKLVETWRTRWAEMQNRALSRAQVDERVDHRSLEAQRESALKRGEGDKADELDRDPQIKMGSARTAIERKAHKALGDDYEPVTEVGQKNEAVKRLHSLWIKTRQALTRLNTLYRGERGKAETPVPPGPKAKDKIEPSLDEMLKAARAEQEPRESFEDWHKRTREKIKADEQQKQELQRQQEIFERQQEQERLDEQQEQERQKAEEIRRRFGFDREHNRGNDRER